MTRKSSRRDFLSGKAVKKAVGKAAAAPATDTAAGNATPESHPAVAVGQSLLIQIGRRAMAGEFEICLNAGQYPAGTEIALETLDLLETLEEQMSFFRPEGEISRINRTASDGPVEVEPRLFEVLELALRLYRETGGAYDITSGPLWAAWGFARRAGAIPSPEQLDEARQRVGSHLVELDHQRRTIRFLQPGVQLNLGSIGKGFAVDCCGQRLLAAGITDFLLHASASSILARGSRRAMQAPGVPAPAGLAPGWSVGIRDPLHPDRRFAEVGLRDRALGTSGGQFQSFRHRGKRYGHILDPRTGWPAEGVLSSTVLAPTAALADGLSTAFYVLGPEAAKEYCRKNSEIAAVLLCPARGGGVEIHTAGVEEGVGLTLARSASEGS